MPSSTVAEDHNLAAVHEAIAAPVPDRECIVWRDRRLSWAEVTDRTRRLAAVLRDHGLGVDGPLAACAPWESPHDHVALYLHNGNEYLEGLLGAAKARAAAVNINFRYVAEELRYVLVDSGATAIMFHGAFAATLAEVLPSVPSLRLLLQVDDDSGAALLPGRAPLRGRPPAQPPPPRPPTSPRTTSTSSTPGAPPACRRGCSGARATSWPPAWASPRPPRS